MSDEASTSSPAEGQKKIVKKVVKKVVKKKVRNRMQAGMASTNFQF